uniref:Uncharacterized protein n=1 Tax=viral metagenome TaxID=1070528 RepID=A0A6C0EIG4_9ZZZZ
MEFKFELHTTISEQLHISVDISKITLEQLHKKIFETIEKNAIFNKEDILDIFVNDTLSICTMSIPCNECLVKDFIPMNRNFFPHGSDGKNTYKIYIIDRTYGERLKNVYDAQKTNTKNRQIKTNHFEGIKEFTRKMIPLW